MTDKEIIKALECCYRSVFYEYCDKCAYFNSGTGSCKLKLLKDAFALINRQQAVIEHLQGEREVFLEDIHHSADQINEQIEEIERLNNDLRVWKDIAHRETGYVETAKFETIKNYLETCEKAATSNAAKVAKAILLEMVGEDK